MNEFKIKNKTQDTLAICSDYFTNQNTENYNNIYLLIESNLYDFKVLYVLSRFIIEKDNNRLYSKLLCKYLSYNEIIMIFNTLKLSDKIFFIKERKLYNNDLDKEMIFLPKTIECFNLIIDTNDKNIIKLYLKRKDLKFINKIKFYLYYLYKLTSKERW